MSYLNKVKYGRQKTKQIVYQVIKYTYQVDWTDVAVLKTFSTENLARDYITSNFTETHKEGPELSIISADVVFSITHGIYNISVVKCIVNDEPIVEKYIHELSEKCPDKFDLEIDEDF